MRPPWENIDLTTAMMKEVVLQRRQYMQQFTFGREFMEGLHFDVTVRTMDEQLIRFFYSVFGETLEEIEVQYPADWWQALRERWFPKWWLRRWPVQYTVRTMKAEAVYPKVSAPNVAHRIIFSLDDRMRNKGSLARLEPV